MPKTFLRDGHESQPLAYKIANIEDNTFPAVDHRAPDSEITLKNVTGIDGTYCSGSMCSRFAGDPNVACDPHYVQGSGSSVVRYLVPITDQTTRAEKMRATLYYQTVPPYYQLQRASDARVWIRTGWCGL
ncbi:MAG: hypothetical protein ACJ74Z_04160 [Bryobacteraceae bacterium]